jgi:hypothetical protein
VSDASHSKPRISNRAQTSYKDKTWTQEDAFMRGFKTAICIQGINLSVFVSLSPQICNTYESQED